MAALRTLVISLLALVMLPSQAAGQSPATLRDEPAKIEPAQVNAVPPPTAPAQALSSDLLIGAGDLVEVSVYGAPDFTRQVRVSDSGEISLPLLGQVKVGQLSIHDAETQIAKQLADGGFFNAPQVSVLVKEYASQGISVLGEVQKPGIYPLPGQRSLFDALSAAGGITPKAGKAISVTHRNRPQEAQNVVLPAGGTLPPESNVPVFPGDTVVVSKAGIIYVVGDVRMPGGFVMENSELTVLQAVAMAQGTNIEAKLDKTVLIRKTPQGHQEIPILLSQVMAAKIPDVKLEADDVVFIPRSAAKAAARKTMETILQMAVGMAIYHPY
jgi:polysaccharide export outer membrane protein